MPLDTLVAWVVILVAAAMQGTTGLGFALVSVPILLLFQDARSVVVTTLILSVLLNGLIVLQARRHICLRDAGLITVGSLLGVPFGSYLLVAISADLLKEMVASLVVLFSVLLLLGHSRTFRHPRAASLVTGAVSGALQSSTSMGSPPVVLFMANQGMAKESFRGTLVLRSMAASTLSVAVLVPTGLLTPDLALDALWFAPALVIGFAAGSRLLRLVPQRLFGRLVVLMVLAAGVVNLAGSLTR